MKFSIQPVVRWYQQNPGVIKKWVVSPLLLMSLAYVVYHWLEDNKPQPEPRAAKVKKVKVFVHQSKQSPTQLLGYSQGKVEPKEELALKAEVAGRVSFLSENLVAGGVIAQGELLIQLADEDYQLRVIAKQAKVAQSEQQLAKAKAESEQAQKELKELQRSDASELARGLPQLRQAQAALAAAKAELAQAELDLSRTKIYAPFDGRVEKRSVTESQWINRGSEVARLFSTDIMEVRLSMSAQQFSQIGLPLAYYTDYQSSSYPVRLYTDLGDGDISWQGKVVRTEAVMDERTRTIFAVAQVHNSYQQGQVPLLKGLFVHAEIAGRTLEQATTLPKQALRNNQMLWLVTKDNKLKVLEAEIAQRAPDSIVVQNLPNKTLVITSALAIPTEGMPVKPIFEDPVLQAEQAKKRAAKIARKPKKPHKNDSKKAGKRVGSKSLNKLTGA